jgi:DNA replication protein DnaC
VLLGDSGTGKTHLLIALGTIAAEQGRRVRYLTCAQLVNELAEAADDKQLSRVVGRYARLELLCLDEIGYLTLDPRGAELLFQIITAREERASIACASNAPFSKAHMLVRTCARWRQNVTGSGLPRGWGRRGRPGRTWRPRGPCRRRRPRSWDPRC